MRRILACLLAVVTIVLVSACGSSSRSGGGAAASNPRTQALSYFPPLSPFVMMVSTAQGSSSAKQMQALEHANPSYALALTALYGRLGSLGIDYNADVRPLFGNPIVLGLGSSTGSSGSLLVAWKTRSAAALHRIIGKLRALRAAGSDQGASLYASSHIAAAVTGATLVLARTVPELRTALQRSAQHAGISSAQYSADMAGVAPDGLFAAFGNLTGVLSEPRAAQARQVPWVAAIRRYGVSVTASAQQVTLSFVLDTGGRALTPAQLPIASGALGPELTGPAPIEAGIRDPAQLVSFALTAMRTSSPRQYAHFLAQTAAFRRATGVDLSSVVGMLTGTLDIDSDGRATLARADVTDPASVAGILSRLARSRASTGLAGSGRLTPAGNGFYRTRHGHRTTYIGIANGRLVVGDAPLASVRDFAAAPAATPTQGGAVAFHVSLGQLIALGLARSRAAGGIPPALAERMIGAIGDLTAMVKATTTGLSGTATIPVHAAALTGGG